MFQDNQLFEDIQSLPPEKKAEVIDFVKRLKDAQSNQQSEEDINLEDDPILQVVGCISGPPISTSKEIDKELYGE